MKISDKIAEVLVSNNITDVFMVTGGMAMHLNDSLTRKKELNVTFFHHEQACAMAADAYSRSTGKISAICVTAGPGGINALNGVFGAYADSIPMLILSGQVRTDTLNSEKNLRQLGDQEAPITKMVESITKYSKTITRKENIEYEIQKAISTLSNGRKGPVWIDIPIDIQGTEFKKTNKLFREKKEISTNKEVEQIKILEKRLNESKRPLIIAGGGIRSSGSTDQFRIFVNKLNIPVVTAFNGHDLLWESHKNFIGRCGTIGDRRGNLAVECADFILVLGSSLNIRQIGYNFEKFGKNKYFCYVDIDKEELSKKTIRQNLDLPINIDLNKFFKLFNVDKIKKNKDHEVFNKWSKKVKKNYSIENESYPDTKKINPYEMTLSLSKMARSNDIILTSNATAAIVPHQAFLTKRNQRFFTNSTSGSMGYGIAASIGASIGNKKSRIICFEGDGSLQMNIQELATISHNKLNIIILVFSNNGYHSIRQTQKNYFSDNLVGIDEETGLSFPNLKDISGGYGLNYIKITKRNVKSFIKNFNKLDTPLLVDVEVDENIDFQPRIKSKKNSEGTIVSPELYDMHPFLPEKEIENLLKIKNN